MSRAIDTVLQSLSSLYHSQVWLLTHSPFVFAHTPLAAMIIMRRNSNGGIETIAGEKHPRLRDWSGDSVVFALACCKVEKSVEP